LVDGFPRFGLRRIDGLTHVNGRRRRAPTLSRSEIEERAVFVVARGAGILKEQPGHGGHGNDDC
jgi:hypothetical protein